MLKKTIIAIAALGIVGSATLMPTAPAEAFFINCAKGSKHADSDRCKERAMKKAERKARWDAFWASLRHGRKK